MNFALRAWLMAAIALFSCFPAQAEEPYRHIIQRGDTLYDLAQAFFIRPSDAVTIKRLNKIADAKHLQIGTTLLIPRKYLKSSALTARVVAYRGSVLVRTPARAAAQAAVGSVVVEGATIETGSNSFVTLAIRGDIKATLPSSSRIRVARLRRYAIDGLVDREFYVLNGRSEWDAAPMRETGGTLRVGTPNATSAVRGTRFRVALNEADNSTAVSVTEGLVAVTVADKPNSRSAGAESAVLLKGGVGLVATSTGLSEALPLLEKPELIEPSRLQNENTLRFSVAPLAGATAYNFRVGSDAGMIDGLSEIISATPSATLPALPDGDYYVRVTAIDRHGLEGLERSYEFRRLFGEIGRLETDARTRDTVFRWIDDGAPGETRFVLSRAADLSEPLVDRIGLETATLTITGLQPGTYYWAVEKILFDGESPRRVGSAPTELVITAK